MCLLRLRILSFVVIDKQRLLVQSYLASWLCDANDSTLPSDLLRISLPCWHRIRRRQTDRPSKHWFCVVLWLIGHFITIQVVLVNHREELMCTTVHNSFLRRHA